MNEQKMPMTPGGYKRLQEELKRLKNEERPKAIQAIAEARGHGDLTENAEYHETKGLPRFYNLVGSNIELFPAPSSSEVTATAGLKIYVSREVDEFVSTDDTQEPGIPKPFHKILSL